MGKVRKERLIKAGLYLAYAVVTLFFLFPIFWVLSTSLKSVPQLFATADLVSSRSPVRKLRLCLHQHSHCPLPVQFGDHSTSHGHLYALDLRARRLRVFQVHFPLQETCPHNGGGVSDDLAGCYLGPTL